MKAILLTLVFLGLFLGGSSQTYQIADSLKALADSAAAQENWSEAADFYDQAIQAEKISPQARQDSLYAALCGSVNSYWELDSLDKALEIGLEAYALAQEVFTAPIVGLAELSNLLGEMYYARGEYKLALEMFHVATYETEKSLGKEHSDYGTYLNNVAYVYQTIGQYDTALPLQLEALENTENSLGKEHSDYGKYLNNLAGLYRFMGQYDTALPLYLEALENTEKSLGKEHSDYGIYLNNLAGLYETMGQYETALPLYLETLENTEKSLGKEHIEYGIRLSNLATLYLRMGQYDTALPLYLEALENTEKSLGKEHSYYGTQLGNLTYLYFAMGQYDMALPLYLEALENTEKSLGKEHSSYGISLNNLAVLYETMGQYDTALPLQLEALENTEKSLGKEHSEYGIRLNNLAVLYETMGQYDTALRLQLEALENTEISLGKEHSQYGSRLNNLAVLYEKMGRYDTALPLYSEALENTEKSLGKEHSWYGNRLNNLANLYVAMGEYKMALPLYLEALENTEKSLGKEHPSYAVRLNGLGGLYEKMNQYEKSLPLYLEAEKNIYNQIDQTFSFMSEKEKEQFYKTVDGYFDHYLSFFATNSKENPEAAAEAYNIELALKGLILDSGIQVRESILSSGDSAAIATYDTWELQRTLISKQYSLPIADRRSDLADLEERTQKLEAELTSMSTVFGEQTKTGSIKCTDVQNALGADEAAIEFSTFDYYDKGRHTDSVYYYAHILLPENEYPVSVFLCEESELNSLLAKTNERNRNYVQRIYGLAERGASLANPDDQVNLAELIWEPMAEYLEDKSRVYYAPSGLLHRLNLNAIEIDAFTTVADKVELVQMGSTGDLLDRKSTQELSMEEAALFGGLEYTTIQAQKEKAPSSKSTAQATETAELNTYASRSSWGDLPYTLREVETISSILEDNQISHSLYTGDLGSEESFLKLTKENKNLDVLHFATHGYFFERDTTSLNLFMRSPNPLFRSGLIMSNANQAWVEGHFEEGQEDGVLTAYEIAQLDLRETELVVLSACETGLGDISNSEGVYGLQRAFKLAGVDYIIMTLWRVPDKQSKIMMEKFYTNWIEEGQDIPLAFRNAQAEMRELFDTYEWGGFVLVE